nr:hypothetical protein [Tanacetum cinerariifolium]
TTVSSPYERRSGDVSPGVDGPLVMPEDPYAYVVSVFQALPLPDYVLGPEEPEQAPPSPVYIPYVSEPVYPEPAAASPTAESPGYIPESDPNVDPEEDDDEDPEEDPADYLADHDDQEEEEEHSGDDADEEDEEQDEDDDDQEEEEEHSGDDADEEDEEQDEDDDDEEEEHPALADFIPPSPALRVTARISFRPQPSTLSFTKEDAERFLAMPIPPPSPLTLLSSPLPQIPSPPLQASPHILPIPLPAVSPPLQLLSSYHRADRPEVTLPPQKSLSIVHCPGYKAGKSLVAAAARSIEGRRADYGFVDSVEAEIRRRRAEDIGYGVNTRVTELAAVQEQDTQDIYGVMEDTQGRRLDVLKRLARILYDLGHLATALGEIRSLQAREQAHAENGTKKAAPKRTTRLNPGATLNPNQAPSTTTTTVTNAQLQAMIDQGVNAALTARDANRTGDDNHTSGT